MRIHLKTTPNNTTVPFNYQQNMVGAIYKWLGSDHELHDSLSLFSFSWLKDGVLQEKGFNFHKGSSFFFSCYDPEVLKRILNGIQMDSELAFGLSISEITIEKDKVFYDSSFRFLLGSPVLIKRNLGTNNTKHFTFEDEESPVLLKETLERKMEKAGIIDETLSIRFDRDYPLAKTKIVNYKGVKNKASMCPVIVEAQPETLTFVWNVGLGNSTGIGFGSLL